MKKVISLFLALTFVFTLAACSNNQPQTNDSSESLSEPTTESDRLVRLPMFYNMTDDEQQTVIERIKAFFA